MPTETEWAELFFGHEMDAAAELEALCEECWWHDSLSELGPQEAWER